MRNRTDHRTERDPAAATGGRRTGQGRPLREDTAGGEAAAERGEWVYGRRPAIETLRAARRHVYELRFAEGARDTPEIGEIRALAAQRGLPWRAAPRSEIDELLPAAHHQGVALRVGGFPYVGFDQVLHDVRSRPDALVLLLDHVEDPQNLGALLRTAEAVAVTAAVLPEDRAAAVTAAVTRASAGASEHLRVARVVNLVRALRDLQEAGAWISGLDADPDARLYTEADFRGRCGLVVGAEGSGLGRLVREACDFLVRVPMLGRVASLNASAAGAVVMYEALRQRAAAPQGAAAPPSAGRSNPK
jgi:23S rRNA (guanosine2251-2'-O)-methyltransferase